MTEIWARIAGFFTQLGSLYRDYIGRLGQLPQLLKEDFSSFLWTIAPLVLLLLAIVLFICAAAAKRRSKKAAAPKRSTQPEQLGKVFIPVESSTAEVDTVFLPLDERIITSRGVLSQDIRERITKLGAKALPDLVSAYKRSTPAIQSQLVDIVRQQGLLEAYSRRLLDPEYPQGVLVDAWYCFPSDAVLKGFVELLASRDQRMQMAAVKLLSALKEPKSLSMLMLALVQPERYLPVRVAEVFVSMPQQSAALLTYMLPEVDDKHKESVLNIIAATETSFDPTNVLTHLRHGNYRIRTAAAAALGAGHIDEALPQLMLAANDKRWQVRAAAAKSLGQLGDNRALAILEALKDDPEGWVAENARAAIDLFRSV